MKMSSTKIFGHLDEQNWNVSKKFANSIFFAISYYHFLALLTIGKSFT
jgi:hypothetical protein